MNSSKALFAIVGTVLCSAVHGQVLVFSTMSEGYVPSGVRWTFMWDQAHNQVGDPNFFGYRYAVKFTVPTGTDYSLSSVSLSLALSTSESVSRNLTVRVYPDNGGTPTFQAADALETLAVDPFVPQALFPARASSLLNMPSLTHPVLLAGMSYHIALEPTTEDLNTSTHDAVYYWDKGDINTSGERSVMYYYSPEGWTALTPSSTLEMPAFQVMGNAVAVPEPGQFALLAGFSLIGFAGWRRMKVQQA